MHQPPLITSRLTLRLLAPSDDQFIYTLLNDKAWLRYIGDKGITDLYQARKYIQTGPLTMFAEHGLGLLLVELTGSKKAIGLCGLLKRQELHWPDLGFAYLPEFRRLGYGYEAALAVLSDGQTRLKLPQIAALTAIDNINSIQLLTKLGFYYVKTLHLIGHQQSSNLYLSTPQR